MRLKKLVASGFKSFADKTVLNFDPGITCIVGPNGCGKSNIADAFRWVMGEQSAKSMRGAKMPDVIFAGTSHRKPLNYAEVSLTLADVQNALPIDYEEVTITRRLHRSGESEYLLNGNPVRLKDLQTLFLGSGIGRNAISIFEQGKLDQVISYTPLERRYIFEEAAGILRFLQRKKEALKRLEQADLNLSRVQDIHSEVEKHIQTLETQAKKARIFKEKKIELEQAEITCFALRWQSIEKKFYDLQTKYAKQQIRLEGCRGQGDLLQKQNQEAKQLRQEHEKRLRILSEQLLTLRGQHEMHSRECQSLQKRLQEGKLRENKLKQENEDFAMAAQTRHKMLGELKSKRQQLEGQWSDAESRWASQQDRVKLHDKEVVRIRQELSSKQQIFLKTVHQNSECQAEIKKLEVKIENLTDHHKQLSIRLDQLKEDARQLTASIQERKKNLQQVSGQVDSHKDRLDHFEDELKKMVRQIEEKQREIDSLRRTIMEVKARQKVLLKMREELEGFSVGTKELLKEAQDVKSPFHNKLRLFYEYFNPKEENVEAFAVVLRAYAQTVVVDNEADAKKLLAFAEKKGIKDFSLLCIDWLKKLQKRSSTASKSLLEKGDSNFLSQYFLGSIGMTESNETAFESLVKGECLEGWSLRGSYFDHRGVFFNIKLGENQVFMRESELKTIEEDLLQKEEHIAKDEQQLQQLNQQRNHVHLERGEIDKMLRRDEMKLVEVNFGLQRALADIEKNKSDQDRTVQELASLMRNLEEMKESFQILDGQNRNANQDLVRLQEERDVLQSELEKQEGSLRIQEEDQKEKGSHYRQLADDRQQMMHQHSLLEAKEQDHGKNVQRIADELEELVDRYDVMKKEEKEAKNKIAGLEQSIQEFSVQYGELEKKGEGLIEMSEQAENCLSVHHDEQKKIETELAQMDIQLAHQKAVSQAVLDELSERCAMNIEEAVKVSAGIGRTLDQTEKLIKSLRQQLQDCGDVNLTAIEDLEKHQERYTFLNQQIGDMQHSNKELLAIIRELDGECYKQFKETFEAIRANFQKNFKILFSGGEADLQLTDEKNILESGIEISAKPPGKQMRSISLLSGGEKCLTAVALLFAIFEVKPAPFCILDEIDAPLDDSNVDRFVNVVKHFVDRCQFLIITHNKRTMAIGDVLFGVSMEEKGVSKLLSLEFAHREVPEATLV